MGVTCCKVGEGRVCAMGTCLVCSLSLVPCFILLYREGVRCDVIPLLFFTLGGITALTGSHCKECCALNIVVLVVVFDVVKLK